MHILKFNMGAACAAHAVDTAGRGGAREAGSSSGSNWVVRVWELADAEAKVQYSAHTAAVHQVAFLGPHSPAVASLDVSGAIHVWSRTTGMQLQAFVPLDLADSGSSFLPPRPAGAVSRQSQSFGAGDGRATAAAAAAAAGAGVPGSAAGGSVRQYAAAPVSGTASAAESRRATAAESRRASVSTAAAGVGAASSVADQQLQAGGASLHADAGAAAAMASGLAVASGGYWERGCSSGRGWQALAALPTAAGGAGAGGSSVSPGSAGAAGGVLDAAAGGAGLGGGPGWPLAGGHLGYTCMVPVDSNHALVETLLLSGSSSSIDDSYGSRGSNTGVLLAGTADGHVCLLDVETGALLEDAVACWDPRPWLYNSGLAGYNKGGSQQLQQQTQAQVNPLMPGTAAPGMLGPAGWDGLSAAADPSNCVLSAVCYSGRGGGGAGVGAVGGWVGAGSGGGRVTLLDMRAGVIVANWQAHSQRVSQLQGLSGVQGDHMLLSCSADKTMKLWDLRMMPQSAAPHANLAAYGGSSGGGYGSTGLTTPLMTYRSGRDGIEGFVVYQDAAIVYGGASIGLAPLNLSAQVGAAAGAGEGVAGGLGGQLQYQQQGSSVQLVRMTAVKGLGYRGSGVREGLGVPGAGSVVGLGLLPHSKLLVVGTENGLLRICR